MNNLEILKYPIGRFQMPATIYDDDMQKYIKILESLPAEMEKTVERFDDAKFDTRYRENGWTIGQVIAHIAESHTRAYAMFKRGLDENNIVVKPNIKNQVPNFGDSQGNTVQDALKIIYGVHERWASELKSLSSSELGLTFFYPDAGRQMPLPEFLAIFAWHSRHHLGHIKGLKDRMGW